MPMCKLNIPSLPAGEAENTDLIVYVKFLSDM